MHIEKIIFCSVIGFAVCIGFMLPVNRQESASFPERSISKGIRMTPDFDISTVLDNTPFNDYYSGGKRNPFIPHREKGRTDVSDQPGYINDVDDTFIFDPDDVPTADDTPSHTDTVIIPDKPGNNDDDPEKVDTDIVKKDESIPVYLIGFAKTEAKQAKNRKAILSHKTTGRIYTVEKGHILLGLSILDVTPYSVTMKLGNGRKIEYCYDLLKPGADSIKI